MYVAALQQDRCTAKDRMLRCFCLLSAAPFRPHSVLPSQLVPPCAGLILLHSFTMCITLPTCRKVQNVDAVPDFPQRVLAAMREGQERQRRLEPEADSWSMPSYALFALQRQGWVSGPVMFCTSYQSLRCQAKSDQWFMYACVLTT